MKKLIFFLLLVINSTLAICQVPNFLPDRSGPGVTAQDARLRGRLNFYFPHTHGLTLNGGLDTVGMTLYEDSSGHCWFRDTVLSGGHRWNMFLKNGDVAGGVTSFNGRTGAVGLLGSDVTTALGFNPLSNVTSYITAGTNVSLTGLGTLVSPYIINANSGPGTVTSFSFTNGNGINGNVTNATSTPTLSLSTSLNGIIKGNCTGFGTIVIGSGLTYDGTTLAVTSGGGSVTTFGFTNTNGLTGVVTNATTTPNLTIGTGLNGLVDANGTGFSTATIGAGLSFSAGTLTNTINNTNQLINGAGFLTNITGLITAGSNVTITGSGTSGSPYSISVAGAGTGTVTNFSAGNLSPLFTTTVTNPTTIPGLTFTLSNASALTVLGNNTGSSAAPIYFTPTSTIINSWYGGTLLTAVNLGYVQNATNNSITNSAGTGATVLPATALLAGLEDTATWRYVDSLRSGKKNFTIFAVQGLKGYGASGDSIGLGGVFFQADTINTAAFAFRITNLPNKTVGGTDSALIEDATGQVFKAKFPTGSGGGIGVDTVTSITTGTSSTVPNGTNVIRINPASVMSTYTLTLPTTWHTSNNLIISFGGTITSGNPVVTTLSIVNGSGQTLLQAVAPTTASSGEVVIYHLIGTIDQRTN